MTKLHDLIVHLQEYEKRYGNMPVYLSSKFMEGSGFDMQPVRSSNVAELHDVIDPATNKTEITYHIAILADYIMNEDGYPMSTEEDKNE